MPHNTSYKAALLATLGLAISPLSHAGISDRTSFTVPPIVILWAANDDTGEVPIVTDFIIQDSNGLNTDLISVDGRTVAPVTGALVPTTDAAYAADFSTDFLVLSSPSAPAIQIDADQPQPFDAFELAGGTTLRSDLGVTYYSSFYIASNTPFNITTSVDEVLTTGDFGLDDVRQYFSFETHGLNEPVPFGTSAQEPGGIELQAQTLADLDGVDILQGARSTAASSGSIADQSVRMDLYYDIADGLTIDLSHGSGTVIADVTYTAYVP